MRIRSILPAALVVTVLLVPRLGAASSPSPQLDIMEQRMQACVACHGKEGRATSTGYFPRIAGKPAGYLYNQLVNFREGRRKNATMGTWLPICPMRICERSLSTSPGLTFPMRLRQRQARTARPRQ